MESWSSFLVSILWLSILALVFNSNNLINLIVFSEIVWVLVYALSSLLGIISDDITIMSLTFLSLAIAGLEFSIGILIITLFKLNTGSVLLIKN